MIIEIPYNRERAVEYARKWALSRNPLFIDFTGIGGNCTNFVSQCIFAGAPIMNYTDTFGWYYISAEQRAPAWSGVDELYSFLTGSADFKETNGGIGPYGIRATMPIQVQIGDVIQLQNSDGEFYHTLIISGFSNGEILICAQSNDALDRPLSSYSYAGLRVIHIEGARLNIDTDTSFIKLIDGEEIVSLSQEASPLEENTDVE